jgi:RNA polymerase sigma factor (sigma-70 family)
MLSNQFFDEVGAHQLLSREEEIKLAQRAKSGDKLAREKMILSNLRLAVKIANEFHNKSSCSLEDLIQESNLGLCKAVDLFDPDLGFKFSTYASWWMKQRVRSHILGNTGIARLPSNARMIAWQAKKISKEYEEEFGRTPALEELANLLNVSESLLRGVTTCTQRAVDLDAPVRSDDGGQRAFHETIEDDKAVDPNSKIDDKRLMQAIYDGMSLLTPREQVVLRLRFGLIEDLKNNPHFAASNLILRNGVDDNGNA